MSAMTPTPTRPEPTPCLHEEFRCECKVGRLSDVEGGPITGYALEVRVICVQCGMHFRFRGIPAGNDPDFPRASIDGQELRAPIEPVDQPRLAASATYRLSAQQKVQ